MTTPNILIIVADDIGVDGFRVDKANGTVVAHVVSNSDDAGPVHLPAFERMLTNGVHFEQAWAHPVCTPTRASLWTGEQAWKTTLGYPLGALGVDIPEQTVTGTPIQTLAQALKAQTNYRCAMFGKWDLGSGKNPVDWGWDYFAGIFGGGLRPVGVREYGFPPPPNRVDYARLQAATNSSKPALCQSVAALLAAEYDATFLQNNPDVRFYIWHKDVVQADGTVQAAQPPTARTHLYATKDQVEEAKQWIAAQAGQPWCVALNLITPHDPLHVPPPGTYQASTFSDPTAPTVQEMLVAMLESMDYYVNDLLQAIDDQLGDTIVIFVGDNGTQDVDPDTGQNVDAVPGDDKNTTGIGGVLVPMIVADGGLMKGGPARYSTAAPCSIAEPVHIIDIYRTVLEIAGINPGAPGDSISMSPHLVTSPSGPTRQHNFSQMYSTAQIAPDGITAFTAGINASVSDGQYKLTCSALTVTSPQGPYLVDELGNKVTQPVFNYAFSRLDPDPAIPGSLIEVPLPVLARSGTGFVITDPAYTATIKQLYLACATERLNSDDARFPYIGPTDPQVVNASVALSQGQSVTLSSLDLHDGDFTIATKVKVGSTAHRNIILGNWGSAGNSWQLLFAVQAGGAPSITLRKDMITNGSNPQQDLLGLQASTSIVANAWHHVAVSFTWGWDRKTPTATIYVGGVAAGTSSPTISPNPAVRDPYQLMPTSNPYLIGRKQDSNDNSSWFTGQLEDFRIYRRALDAAEIQALASS